MPVKYWKCPNDWKGNMESNHERVEVYRAGPDYTAAFYSGMVLDDSQLWI